MGWGPGLRKTVDGTAPRHRLLWAWGGGWEGAIRYTRGRFSVLDVIVLGVGGVCETYSMVFCVRITEEGFLGCGDGERVQRLGGFSWIA